MRLAHVLTLSAAMLLAPPTARAQSAPVATPVAMEVAPRSTALAVALEVVSPLGGAGCFYRRRYWVGALVTAAAAITGGTMLHGLTHNNGDEVSLNAVGYGISRLVGVVMAARPDPPPAPAPPLPEPAPRAAALPGIPAKTIGLSYGFAF